MSVQFWMTVLAVWTVAGLFAAIAFGHMVPREDRDREEAVLSPAGPNVRYFRRKKRTIASRAASRATLKPDAAHRGATAATLHRKR